MEKKKEIISQLKRRNTLLRFYNCNSPPLFISLFQESAAEFDDIPRQMQALSESIQERDRYIFGDRPRQRVNTGDFTQVKWQ